jgi:hypothetical protein
LAISWWGAKPSILDEERGRAFVQARKNRRAQHDAQQNVQNNAQIAQNTLQGGFDGMNLGNQNAGEQGQGHANQ